MAMVRKIQRSSNWDTITIGEAFDAFVREKEARNLSPATIRSYEDTHKLFLKFFELDADAPIDKVSKDMFFEWSNSMKLDGIKTSSINHYLRDCRAFFYWCMDNDRKYLEEFKITMLEAQEEQIKLFSDEELALLLEKPRRNDGFTEWRTWAMVNWVLATGNRASTLCNIKIEDVDFRRKEIALAHTKNKKAQIIPLSSSLETVLKEYMRVWRYGADDESWLFCNIGEDKLTTNALRHAFSRYCKAREVKHTNIHGLRHNFAKGWLRNNGDMFKLQKILGHSSLDMTRRYVRLFSEDIKEDFDKFSPLDSIKRSAKRTHNVKRNYYY